MKTQIRHTARRAGFTLVELLVVIAIIAALAGLATPVILRAQKAAATTEAINNAKQLGTFLFLFNNDFGTFPGPDTEERAEGRSGSTANDYLSQLITSGITDSEEIFYAKAAGVIKPDSVVTESKALEQGENAFGYVMLSGEEPLSTGYNGGMPVVVTPLKKGASGTSDMFDDAPFDNKGVYLRLDQSVQSKRIKDGNIKLDSGKDLFETGADSVWGEENTPDVKMPDLAG